MDQRQNGINVGQLSGRYELLKQLGQGGMAEVWLALDRQNGRTVAIKIINSQHPDSELLRRFSKEAERLSELNHTHILRIYDWYSGSTSATQKQGLDSPYIVMEYVEGGDLKERLKQRKGQPYPLEETLHIFAELCGAVQYAHDRGVIHRDLKPANILFRRPKNRPEEVVLSDFGLAVEVDDSHLSLPNAGTPAYMAPEQYNGEANEVSDIYALGVILYQLCTGWLPAQKDNSRPGELNPGLPKQLDKVILTALRKEPTKRFASASNFAEAVREAVTASKNNTLFPPINVRNSTLPLPPTTPSPISHVAVFPVSNPPATPALAVQTDPQPIILATKPDNVGVIAAPVTIDLGAARTGSAMGTTALAPPVSGAKTISSSPTRRNAAPRWLIAAALVILILLVVFGGIAYAAPGILRNLTNIVPGGASPSSSTTATITPTAKIIKNTYAITAVTGTPGASRRQVQARNLTSTTPAQSRTANVTGIKQTPGVRATGSLTFYDGSNAPFSVAAGTVFATGEQYVNASNAVQCTPHVVSNHQAGDKASSVTATVTVTSTAEVYDQQAAETMAVTLYKNDSTINPGSGFALSGNVTAHLTQATVVDSKGTVSLLVDAQKTWVYQITSTQEKAWTQHIKGMSKQAAQAYLLDQSGVSAVSIQLSAGNTLPTDPTQISFVINGPGLSSNPTPGSSPVSPGGTPTATPTPVSGSGGS